MQLVTPINWIKSFLEGRFQITRYNGANSKHPDKNKSPEAEAKFVDISKAYELLSDEDRRRKYDQFGVTEEQQGAQRRQQSPFGGFPFNFGGGGFRFEGGFPGFEDSDPDEFLINRHIYNSKVLPESHRRLYVLYIYSDWCMMCHRVRKMFNAVRSNLAKQGISFVTCDVDLERGLVWQLGVSRLPHLALITRGRVVPFTSDYTVPNIEKFIHSFATTKHIVEIVNAEEFEGYRQSIIDINKPLVVLVDSSIPLWYQSLSSLFRRTHVFVFADSSNPVLLKKFQERSIMKIYVSPENSIREVATTDMEFETAESLLDEYMYLPIPRLSCQEIYENVCSISTSVRDRKFCFVTILPHVDDAYIKMMSEMSKSSLPYARKTTFSYIAPSSLQYDFLSSLAMPSSTKPQVVVLLRTSATNVYYRWIPDGWSKPESIDSIEGFISNIQSGRFKMINSTSINSQLYDEFAENSFFEWLEDFGLRLTELFSTIPSYISWMFSSEEGILVTSLGALVVFLLISSIYSILGDDPGKKLAQKSARIAKQTKKIQDSTFQIEQLTPLIFNKTVVEKKRSVLLAAAVIDIQGSEFDEALRNYYNQIYYLKKRFPSLIVTVMDRDLAATLVSCLKQVSNSFTLADDNLNGHLFLFNGFSEYFCNYKPVHSSAEFLGVDLQCNWFRGLETFTMDFCEGQTERYHVRSWPEFS